VEALDDISFDYLVNIQAYSDEELKELIRRLSDEEKELSKRRRLLHGQIDILRAEVQRRLRDKHQGGSDLAGDVKVDVLTDVLSGRPAKNPAKGEG
jgi:hypothetical protein